MKEPNITISVRILKSDVAIARDRLVELGLSTNTRTLSDIIRNTMYAGITIMNNMSKKKEKNVPSKDSIAFIDNIRSKTLGNITIAEMTKKLTKE